MTRKLFFTVVACIAFSIGAFDLVLPGILIEHVKYALPSETANVMARTGGILLVAFGILNFLVRNDEDSPTLRSVFIANIFLQICIVPIDPIAYLNGTYKTLGSFIPNTIIHVLLVCGFAFYLSKMKKTYLKLRA